MRLIESIKRLLNGKPIELPREPERPWYTYNRETRRRFGIYARTHGPVQQAAMPRYVRRNIYRIVEGARTRRQRKAQARINRALEGRLS